MLIIYVCVDVKPISVIGVAHQQQLDAISRGFEKSPVEHAHPEGLLAFICKYLVDVSFLPGFVPPVPPDVPPAAADNVRDAEDVSRVPSSAHNMEGYDVELFELGPSRKGPRLEGEV